jgi:uncharacterized membrane protein YfbV (UPF0208 family)
MKKQIKKENNAAPAAAGLAALAAAAAGVYFLYGSKDATKNRKKITSWSLKMKAEVLEKIEKLKDIDDKVYNEIVETVSAKYLALKNTDNADVEAIKKELSSHWKAIKNKITPVPKKVVKKVAKKVAKKVVKKA